LDVDINFGTAALGEILIWGTASEQNSVVNFGLWEGSV
jgi:hypothetical protein